MSVLYGALNGKVLVFDRGEKAERKNISPESGCQDGCLLRCFYFILLLLPSSSFYHSEMI